MEVEILVQFNGHWDSANRYCDFQVAGFMIENSCSFKQFQTAIAELLNIDLSKQQFEIKFVVKDAYPPMSINNDMSVKLYIQQKRKKPDMIDFPISVTLIRNLTSAGSSTALNYMEGIEISSNELGMIDMKIEEGDHIVQIDEGNIIMDEYHRNIKTGQVFRDKDVLSSVMKHYAIYRKFQLKVDRSCSRRYCLICIDEQCEWVLKSSSVGKSNLFKVTSFKDEHTCSHEQRFNAQRQATASVIGGMIKENYEDPRTVYTPADIMRYMKKEHSVDINYMQAWRSKEKALQIVRGKPRDSYKKLPSYLYVLHHANPGSIIRLHTAANGRFLYAFVALVTTIEGWKYCRPTVVVDASFLRGAYGGTYIIACAQDAGGHILPLAYAVVDSENYASYHWFFQCFKEAYAQRDGMCFVSDRNESIHNALTTVYPHVPHCICIFYLWNNIKVKFNRTHKKISKTYYKLARAYTVTEFNIHMGTIGKIDSNVKQYLIDAGYKRWSRAYSIANRTNTMTSNNAESVNSRMRNIRYLPVINFLDYMMHLVREWNFKNRMEALGTCKELKLSKKYDDILRAEIIASKTMKVLPSNDFLHSVVDGLVTYQVSLAEKRCTCRWFDLEDMPCRHALAVLDKFKLCPYQYCSEYYTRESFIQTYAIPVYLIPDETTWQIPEEVLSQEVLPPIGRIPPGRPKTGRIKSNWEMSYEKVQLTCQRCGRKGHNRRTCKNVPIDP